MKEKQTVACVWVNAFMMIFSCCCFFFFLSFFSPMNLINQTFTLNCILVFSLSSSSSSSSSSSTFFLAYIYFFKICEGTQNSCNPIFFWLMYSVIQETAAEDTQMDGKKRYPQCCCCVHYGAISLHLHLHESSVFYLSGSLTFFFPILFKHVKWR